MSEVRLMTLDPGHFHAALVQKEMYPGVARQVHVYAPLGPDLIAHLNRLSGFNRRTSDPTAWELEVHAGPDCLERMLREHPGNVVVLSGRNRQKIDFILAAVQAGLNVLADKPWVISAEDLPRLETALDTAAGNGLVAYDIMTERYEITTILQKELVNDPETFGIVVAGTEQEPGVFLESVHYLMKTVAGVPNRRPAWFFDIREQGEGLTDVGTHQVDLVPWVLFPGQPLDYRSDICLLSARRWPTVLSRTNFSRVTGEPEFPDTLTPHIAEGQLNYYCNTAISYMVRGVHIGIGTLWDFEASAGAGDTHLAVFRGSRASVEVRQGPEQNYRPELYVVPALTADMPEVRGAVQRKIQTLAEAYPGLVVEEVGERLWVRIPDRYRTGHEAHFGQVTRQFLGYLQKPGSMPAWERPNMLAKYFVTTKGVELSRQTPAAGDCASGSPRPRRE